MACFRIFIDDDDGDDSTYTELCTARGAGVPNSVSIAVDN